MNGLKKTLVAVVSAAVLLGLIAALTSETADPIRDYALWRTSWVVDRGPGIIALNNITVVFLTLFGGALFSMAEIKSHEILPGGVYTLLDKLSRPLHRVFAFFDESIVVLDNPAKSCFFIGVSLPVMIIFINVFLFTALVASALNSANLRLQTATPTLIIALTEFSCVIAAATPAYKLVRENFPCYIRNDTKELRGLQATYLKSKRNWLLFIILAVVLYITGALEYNFMAK